MKLIYSISEKKSVIIVLLIIILIAIIITFMQAYNDSINNSIDFDVFIKSSKDLLKGSNPYSEMGWGSFVYPLFLPFLFIPMSFLPKFLQFLLWFFMNIGFLFFSIIISIQLFSTFLCFKLSRIQELFILLLVFICCFIGVQSNLRLGQINLIILFTMLMFFKFHIEKKLLISSLFLSFGISIKLLPLIFIVFLILRKDFRTLFFTFIFCCIFVFILPMIVIGFDSVVDYYTFYVNNFFLSGNFKSNNSFLPLLIDNLFQNKVPFFLNYLISFFIVIAPIIVYAIKSKHNVRLKLTLLFIINFLLIILISPKLQTHYFIYVIPIVVFIIIALLKEVSIGFKGYWHLLLVFVLFFIGMYSFRPFNFIIYISCIITYAFLLLRKYNFLEN